MKKTDITNAVIREAQECADFLYFNGLLHRDEKVNISDRINKRLADSNSSKKEICGISNIPVPWYGWGGSGGTWGKPIVILK